MPMLNESFTINVNDSEAGFDRDFNNLMGTLYGPLFYDYRKII